MLLFHASDGEIGAVVNTSGLVTVLQRTLRQHYTASELNAR